MKWLWGFCLLFSNKRMNVLDKSHVKTYTNSWIDIWKAEPTPLSDLRINEAWKSIIWCTENKNRDNAVCIVYKHTNYLILIRQDEKEKKLRIEGIVESPENIYTIHKSNHIHDNLLSIARQNNYTLDYSPLRNWSHGFHFYEYQN